MAIYHLIHLVPEDLFNLSDLKEQIINVRSEILTSLFRNVRRTLGHPPSPEKDFDRYKKTKAPPVFREEHFVTRTSGNTRRY